MSNRDPAFLFYSKDFYEATRTMLPKERACYIDLLIYQHQNKYIPDEIERISMYCSGIDEATLKATLKAKFKLCDKGWYNERLNTVIEQRKIFSGKQSDNGAVGQFFKKAKSTLPIATYDKLKSFIYNVYTKDKLVNELKINNNHEAMLEAMLKHLVNVNVDVIVDVNKDINNEDEFVLFISNFNKVRNSNFSSKSKKIESSFNARIKEGYTIEKIIMATKTAMREKYHIENKFRHITPEFMTRIDKLEKYAQTDIGTDGSHVGFYKDKPILESNGRKFIHIGEGVEYVYPPAPDTTGWTDEEKYNYFTCDRYDGYWSDLYKKAMDSQMNTTEKEKRGIYKWFYNQETLRFKEANHRNVRTS